MNLLKHKKIVIVTHVFATGPTQELEEYLKNRVKGLLFIGHPFSYASDIKSFYKKYEKGALVKEKKAFSWKLPGPLMWFKDVLYTIFWTLCTKEKFDLYVGADPLNALTGIILKCIRKTKKTIFYKIDYVPHRFNNKFLNWIYHKIDRFCVERSDLVWNLSERMIEARKEKGVSRTDNQMVVPIGVHFGRINRLEIGEINRKYIVYMGHLRKKQGVELIIESLSGIVREIPDIKLIIIGTGELEKYLKEKARELGVMDYVEFKGHIEDHRDVESVLTECAVGLALYEPQPDSFTCYTDPSKPKQYLACGLPVIITKVPWIAYEINRRRTGVVIDYDKEKLKEILVTLLTDDALYKKYRQNAIAFASKFEWSEVFDKAFKDTFNS